MVSRRDHFTFRQKIQFWLMRHWMSDVTYAEWSLYRWQGGGDVKNPTTFNEKIHWLKLNDRNPLYHQLVDKYAVREYVTERIGGTYLNEIYAVFDTFDQVDIDDLPGSFVLKATHGSGMNLLVRDKGALERTAVRRLLREWMSVDYYWVGREWAYRGVPRRILCERFIFDEQGAPPADYKVFCFGGRPEFIQVDLDRFGTHKRVFFDARWNKLNFEWLYPGSSDEVARPQRLSEMLRCAETLSQGIPFVRVDYTHLIWVFGLGFSGNRLTSMLSSTPCATTD